MIRWRFRCGARAFTLLELVITILIVSTALLYLQNAVTDSIDGLQNALKQRTARTLARQKLEEFLASKGANGGQGHFEDPEYADFQFDIQQQDITVGESQTILRITVVVSYLIDADPHASRQNRQSFGNSDSGDSQRGQSTLLTYAPSFEAN